VIRPTKTTDKRLRCQQPLWSFGIEKVRVGGRRGGWQLLFGALAETGEDVLPLEMLACRACGRVEFRISE
jgi:hypothetical protein